MNGFRLLTADEIDCRVATVKENGVSLLLYKDARCDMNILDETVGYMNWQKRYSRDNANCEVGIYCADRNEWIWKEDTGTESNTEKEKGLASDSFKRACFNWGIGRELYTAPFIWVKAEDCNITKGANGRPACYDRFTVFRIGYDERGRINDLCIKNGSKAVYEMSVKKDKAETYMEQAKAEKAAPKTTKKNARVSNTVTKEQITDLRVFFAENDIMEDYVVKQSFRHNDISEMTPSEYTLTIQNPQRVKAGSDKWRVERGLVPAV